MAKKEPKPRVSRFMGMTESTDIGPLGTWLEPESIIYPHGRMERRARAVNVEDGKLRVVRCGIPDTVWTVPVRGGGYLDTSDGGILLYHPPIRKQLQSYRSGGTNATE